MNETETRAEHIGPALKAAGWGVAKGSRIRREFPIVPMANEMALPGNAAVPPEAAP
jgi:hypothetical protein